MGITICGKWINMYLRKSSICTWTLFRFLNIISFSFSPLSEDHVWRFLSNHVNSSLQVSTCNIRHNWRINDSKSTNPNNSAKWKKILIYYLATQVKCIDLVYEYHLNLLSTTAKGSSAPLPMAHVPDACMKLVADCFA